MEGTRPSPRVEHLRCPYCHDEVRPEQPKQGCRFCMAWHHEECWKEFGDRCATCGSHLAPRPAAASGARTGVIGNGRMPARRTSWPLRRIGLALVCATLGLAPTVILLARNAKALGHEGNAVFLLAGATAGAILFGILDRATRGGRSRRGRA